METSDIPNSHKALSKELVIVVKHSGLIAAVASMFVSVSSA